MFQVSSPQPDLTAACTGPAPTPPAGDMNPGVGLIPPDEWALLAEYLQLSAREFMVAVLMFEGNSRDQIARRLGCAQGTVRVYIDRLFAKLNVDDRLGMALRVVRVHQALTADPGPPASHKDATRGAPKTG